MYWQTHIRSSKLRNNSSILKFYHGVNHTLWLDNYLNMIQIHIKQPPCFHNFQTFIDQCRRIYGNLLSHHPVWMFQSISKRNCFQIFTLSSTERSARCSNQQFIYLRTVFSIQRLKNRTVLAVHRQNLHTIFFCHRHNQMTRCHKCLFICKRDVLTCTDSFNRRTNSKHTHNCCNKKFCFRHGSQFQKPIHSGNNFCICIFNLICKIFRCVFIPYSNKTWRKLPNLFFQFPDVSSGTDTQHFDISIGPDYIQRLCSDRTCGS